MFFIHSTVQKYSETLYPDLAFSGRDSPRISAKKIPVGIGWLRAGDDNTMNKKHFPTEVLVDHNKGMQQIYRNKKIYLWNRFFWIFPLTYSILKLRYLN